VYVAIAALGRTRKVQVDKNDRPLYATAQSTDSHKLTKLREKGTDDVIVYVLLHDNGQTRMQSVPHQLIRMCTEYAFEVSYTIVLFEFLNHEYISSGITHVLNKYVM
jgi:hypothetical protein